MPTETDPRYTLTELADLAGVTPRTVRYYITQGLLLAVDVSPGPGPKYDDTHLARLHLIKRLQAEHQPLAEIRRRLEGLADAEVLAIAEERTPPPSDSAIDYIRGLTAKTHAVRVAPAALFSRAYVSAPTEPAPPAPQTEAVARLKRSQWERIDLAPDIELHVRRPLTRQTAKQLDRLIQIARDLFAKENQP